MHGGAACEFVLLEDCSSVRARDDVGHRGHWSRLAGRGHVGYGGALLQLLAQTRRCLPDPGNKVADLVPEHVRSVLGGLQHFAQPAVKTTTSQGAWELNFKYELNHSSTLHLL